MTDPVCSHHDPTVQHRRGQGSILRSGRAGRKGPFDHHRQKRPASRKACPADCEAAESQTGLRQRLALGRADRGADATMDSGGTRSADERPDRVNLLLDTQIAIWFAASSPKLPRAALDAMERAHALYLSAASIWEMALKSRELKIDLARLAKRFADSGILALPVTWEHAMRSG